MAITERYVTQNGTGTYAQSISTSTPMSWATMLTNAAAGDRCNIVASAGTFSRTTNTDTLTNAGTITSPIIIRGCSAVATPTDGYLGRGSTGSGLLVTTNMPSITYTTGRIGAANFVIWESLNVTSASTQSTLPMGTDSLVTRCVVTNTGTNANSVAITGAARGYIFNCDAFFAGASNGSSAVNLGGATLDSCRIQVTTSTTASGVINATAGANVIFCQIYSSGGNGITITNTAANMFIRSNTIYACGGDGINVITGSTGPSRIVGNMITDNTGDGIDMVSTSNGAYAAYNRTRDNASGYANAGDWLTATKYGDVTTDTGTDTSDYVNAGAGDFTLVYTSPATNASFPAYASMGALQRESTAGTSTGGGFFVQ